MTRLRFQRYQRLLTAKAFTPVFNDPTHKLGDRAFLILARESDPESAARLGLVVAKKNLKRAVDRNRFKRLVREQFRQMQHQLGGLDIVILARRGSEPLLYGKLDDILLRQLTKLAKFNERNRSSMNESP